MVEAKCGPSVVVVSCTHIQRERERLSSGSKLVEAQGNVGTRNSDSDWGPKSQFRQDFKHTDTEKKMPVS